MNQRLNLFQTYSLGVSFSFVCFFVLIGSCYVPQADLQLGIFPTANIKNTHHDTWSDFS